MKNIGSLFQLAVPYIVGSDHHRHLRPDVKLRIKGIQHSGFLFYNKTAP